MALEIGDDDDSSARSLDLFLADDPTGPPVAALDQNIGEKGGDDLLRGFPGEGRQIIDIFDGAEDFKTFLERKHGPRRPLDLSDRGVGIERHDQHVAQAFGFPEKFDVTAVDQVKAAVGKNDFFALAAQPRPNLEEVC